MPESVSIALITALTGFGGALVGAGAAVVGPWLLAASERKRAAEIVRREEFRKSIIDLVDAQMHITALGVPLPAGQQGVAREANRALNDLLSRIRKEDRGVRAFVERWINHAVSSNDMVYRRFYIGHGATMLFQWFAGERSGDDLQEFEIVNLKPGGAYDVAYLGPARPGGSSATIRTTLK